MDNPLIDFKRDPDSLLSTKISLTDISPEKVQQAIKDNETPGFRSSVVGFSFHGRPLKMLTMGSGDIKVFAWSQMHGDEPTATASLIDLIELLGRDNYAQWCEKWNSRITLYLLPMLNPDGAVMKTRHNGQGIDINRDAAVTQSPEGKVLRDLINQIKPDFAFNLHDQSRYYAVGNKKLPATVSFLSPPGDTQNTVTPNRKEAMALISLFVNHMRPHLGECMAKYQDEYSMRAFGDYASHQGASCILIESGSSLNDKSRTMARKMNLLALLLSLEYLGIEDMQLQPIEPYVQLPLNTENGFTDLLIKGITVKGKKRNDYQIDVAIDVSPENGGSVVRELGDLRNLAGFTTIDGEGLHIIQGKSTCVDKEITLSREKYLSLLRSGTLFFSGKTHLLVNESGLPAIIEQNSDSGCQQAVLGKSATLLLGNDQHILYAVLDGTVVDLRQ